MQKKEDAPSPSYSRLLLPFIQLIAIIQADIRKLRHDPMEMITRMAQPAIWLLIFGQAMSRTHAIPTGYFSYLDYMAPGVLAQSILIIAIFYGIAIIWEKDLGLLHKIMVTPTPRFILVLGRSIASGIRGIPQVIIISLLSLLLRIHLNPNPLNWLGILAMAMIVGATFSAFSLSIASLVKTRERFMGIGQILIMPLFFASNALYPTSIMPNWLRFFSVFNPLTYHVDALRTLMIAKEASQFGLGFDFAISIVVLCILLTIATWLSPKALY